MTDSYTFKKFSKTEFLEEIPDNATLLIEDGGDIKRVPASQVGGTDVQADLGQNDSTAPDYVKGRTHWVDVVDTTFINNMEVTTVDAFERGFGIYNCEPLFEVSSNGVEYVVVFDGVEYRDVIFALPNGYCGLGNLSIMMPEAEDTGEPFLIANMTADSLMIATKEIGTHTLSVYGKVTTYHKIDNNYLPDNALIGAKGTGKGSEIFNDYANNVASGKYSHAEGINTTSSGFASHSEGELTVASGDGAHAEGESTVASGALSHAEGHETVASGTWSHSEGQFTIAASDWQHVQGKYNVEDPNHRYAHIVGNGIMDARSNAHTLDWNGNAWYRGTVEGVAMIVKSSTKGSDKKFKITVDDSGTISATEITE
jgi:hypothetical protein